jgi:DNA (cytosine-5)-methyltransferase 1
MEKGIKYFSLFSGIGGFEKGIEQAYVDITNRKKNREGEANPKENARARKGLVASPGKVSSTKARQSGELPDWSDDPRAPHCVGYSEIDKFAIQIYQKHFPKHENYGDINLVRAYDLPDFDLLVGGFPCQSFSIAGKRKGFEDTRGTLFFEIARILRKKQPRLVLLENVKGLLSHDEGRTFRIIISTLDELGYDIQWQVLNSKNFGVPQNRERVFIAGHLRGTPRPQVFPIRSNGEQNTQIHEGKKEIAQTVNATYAKNQSDAQYIIHNVYGGFGEQNVREFHDYSPTIRTPKGGGHLPMVVKKLLIRKLTPTECERLQGFPDGWTKYGIKITDKKLMGFPIYQFIEMSDAQRYKTLGNAVTVNVVKEIMVRLLA